MNRDGRPNEIIGEEGRDEDPGGVKTILPALDELDSAVEPIESRQAPIESGEARLVAGDRRDPPGPSHPRSRSVSWRLATAARGLRSHIGTDTGGFGSVFVVVAVVAVSLLLGYATSADVASPLLTATLFCLLVFAALFWAVRRPANFSARASEPAHRTGGRWKVLLVASESPTVEQLHVLRTAVPRATVEVHAPILRPRDSLLTADISQEIELARDRLRTTLTRAGRAGIDASGEVGDPIDPVAAIEDQLRRHHVDEVVVATNPLSGGNAVESDLLRKLRSQLQKPLTHVEIR